MDELANIRLKHAFLGGLVVQIKNYLDCSEREYFGKLNSKEKHACETLRKTTDILESILFDYYDEESKILGD